jgi:hypothetical protein
MVVFITASTKAEEARASLVSKKKCFHYLIISKITSF